MGSIEDWDSARLAVVGDLHANQAVTARMLEAAAADGCDTVVSVGDLGVAWLGDGHRFVNWLDRQLAEVGLPMVFVDGNHEGWPLLAQLRGDQPGRLHHLTERLVWADRGARWCWQGVRFGALGGAYSIDSYRRQAGVDWFPDLEQPTPHDVARLVGGGFCDVLVCHEAPAEVGLVSRYPEGCRAEVAARGARRRVSDAVVGTDARAVFHGHWHHRHDTRVRIGAGAVEVSGLGSDTGPLEELWVAVDVAALAPQAMAAA